MTVVDRHVVRVTADVPEDDFVNVATDNLRYNGVYTIMDTGPRVQGRALDLYMWSCKEALSFGRKPIQVTVLRLGWNPQASTPSLVDRLFREIIRILLLGLRADNSPAKPRPTKSPTVSKPAVKRRLS